MHDAVRAANDMELVCGIRPDAGGSTSPCAMTGGGRAQRWTADKRLVDFCPTVADCVYRAGGVDP